MFTMTKTLNKYIIVDLSGIVKWLFSQSWMLLQYIIVYLRFSFSLSLSHIHLLFSPCIFYKYLIIDLRLYTTMIIIDCCKRSYTYQQLIWINYCWITKTNSRTKKWKGWKVQSMCVCSCSCPPYSMKGTLNRVVE